MFWEFYVAYQIELKRVHPQGMLLKGGDPLLSVLIRGVRVNISTQTISRFLHGLDFQLPANTAEIDHHMDEM